ncbi:piggyBac transposable element-derived protein 3-like, partial [Sitodiplosis mosellana]|uniref:piggyBac transposable element-derived protein 3-like n=1 Tax=Sitodiplosis mosellana TaxID=263140 RepID=UPI0024439E6A
MSKKLSLKDAVDYLEQLIDEEEEDDFMRDIDGIYIEPPEDDGNVSGEDEANENEGGTVDALSRNQLNAGCELVLRNGVHTETFDIEESAQNENVFKWLKQGDSAAIPVFPEPNFDDCRDVQPHELFERFYDDDLLQHICDCSERYSVLHLQKPVNVTVPELRAFIGILLVTGYNTVSNIKAYWNSSDDLRNEMIFQTMRRNRFQEILRVLHFEPNLNPPANNKDKLWKLRPIMDHLKANFLKNFHPTQNLSYDESMIAYYGKHGCKQFIKGKPIRFGYKVWSLCTPSGYL